MKKKGGKDVTTITECSVGVDEICAAAGELTPEAHAACQRDRHKAEETDLQSYVHSPNTRKWLGDGGC